MRQPGGEVFRAVLRAAGLLVAGLLFVGLDALAQTPQTPVSKQSSGGEARLPKLSGPPNGSACNAQADALARVLCTGILRVGVRADYPPYGWRGTDSLQGFEIDLARQLASRLGVVAEFSVVTAANRITLLGEGRIDLVVATMGHTLQRDREVLFVRPHYYQSQTIVLGRKDFVLDKTEPVRGKTVCVTLGNSTNAELSSMGVRLMLFDNALRLLDELRLGACSLAAQDDSFFASYLQQPAFSAVYEVKLGFAPLPWGVAVAREGGGKLAEALALALKQMHAGGGLQALAAVHGVDSRFLADQRALWSGSRCAAGQALADPGCVLPPRDSQLVPTSFAPAVDTIEKRIKEVTGAKVTLAMFKTKVALGLFMEGIFFSLLLVSGAVAATLGLALVFGAALSSRHAWLRWPMRCLLWVMQSTPMILLMILAGVLISAFGAISPVSALLGAIVVLGLFNGSNAGQAIAEAMAMLKAERPGESPPPLFTAVHRCSAQVGAFIVNATRGSPAASVIGVPELLSALTDIASFSSERVTTYTLLLVFYMLVVALVVRLSHAWQARLARREFARA
ncbi:MAG: transporter substrate-binding domain-containing protein [Pseudomonadota bacterium]